MRPAKDAIEAAASMARWEWMQGFRREARGVGGHPSPTKKHIICLKSCSVHGRAACANGLAIPSIRERSVLPEQRRGGE